eukprot:gene11044-14828_t
MNALLSTWIIVIFAIFASSHDFDNKSKIIGFYNIYASGYNYDRIVKEQLDVMISSGLYDLIDSIKYITAGEDVNYFVPLTIANHNVTLSKFTKMAHIYDGQEGDTLNLLWKHCSTSPMDKVLYFHNKGSFHLTKRNENFRFVLDCFNLNPSCINVLDDHDTCGFKFTVLPYPHYSGNFWWATCRHINKLISPLSPRTNESFQQASLTIMGGVPIENPMGCSLGLGRYFAETWIGTLPNFSPADCLPPEVNNNYILGYDLPNVQEYCPWYIYHKPHFGLSCQTSSLLATPEKYPNYLIRSSNSDKSLEHINQLILRSNLWYGSDPTLIVDFLSKFKSVNP